MTTRSINLSLHIHETVEEMANQAARLFAVACAKAVEERCVFRVALSGGTTPVPFFRKLASEEWAGKLPWEKIIFFWVDERKVAPDHPDSNFGLCRRELLTRVQATHFYRMRPEEDVEREASRYEELLKNEFGLNGGELPRFDFMLLGMGADGHTASIFPDSPLLAATSRLVSDVYVPGRNADRISLTLPVINNSRICMFLVSGEEKRHALKQVLDILAKPVLPAQRIRPVAGELIWLVDEKAAGMAD